MKRTLIITGTILAVLAILVGTWIVDNYVYPFKADSPNFSDVEKAFAKLQFPTDWKETSSSENRGLHGRGCDPLNDSGCFHKSKTFKIDDVQVVNTKIREILMSQGGCSGVAEDTTYEGNTNRSPRTVTEFTCQVSGGIIYRASTSQQKGEVHVGANTF